MSDKTGLASPEGAAGYFRRASTLMQVGRPEEALRVIGQGLVIAPEDASLLRCQALALLELGRRSEALSAVSDAIAAEPNEPNGHIIRSSVVLAHAKELKGPERADIAGRAAAAAQDAIELNPNLPSAYRHLAESLAYCGQAERAWKAALKALQLAPSDHTSWVTASLVGIVCGGDPRVVELACRRALRLNPQSYAALNNLGVSLMTQGRRREAAPILRQAAAQSPQRTTAVTNLVRLGTFALNLAILLALCGLFFTPIGTGATIGLLITAVLIMRLTFMAEATRGVAIRVALQLPRLGLPSISTLAGAAAVAGGIALVSLHRPVVPAALLIAVGVAALAVPSFRTLRRRRLREQVPATFPVRPVVGRLPRVGRLAIPTVTFAAMIVSAVLNSTSNPSFSSPSLPPPPTALLPSGGQALGSILHDTLTTGASAFLPADAALPAGFRPGVPTGPLQAFQVANQYEIDESTLSSLGLTSAYLQTATETSGTSLTRTSLVFNTPDEAATFVGLVRSSLQSEGRVAVGESKSCTSITVYADPSNRGVDTTLSTGSAAIDIRVNNSGAPDDQLTGAVEQVLSYLDVNDRATGISC